MNNRLYVENLGPGITDQSLKDLFSQKGEVVEVKMVLDPATGRSNGRAYVTMATEAIASAALAFHSHSLDGRNIAVTQARPIEAKPVGMIGQGFDVYQSPDQQRAAVRNASQQRRGRNGRRRFAPSK